MKLFAKELGVFIGRAILFLLFYYAAGVFISGAYTDIMPSANNLWQPLVALSVYLSIVLLLFFALGLVMRFFSKSEWSLYGAALFCAAVFVWGIVTTLADDIAIVMGGMFREIAYGTGYPLYKLIYDVFKDSLNDYKYIFIIFWLLIAMALLLGLRYKHISKENRKKVSFIGMAVLFAIAVSINLPTMIHVFTPRIFSEADYPQIDGATAAIPLGQTLARELLGKDFMEAQRFVNFNTTHNAYVNLIEGRADIVFAAEPSDEEIELAKNNGVELKLTPIGMDAFVFIVNNQNPVDGLTDGQIRQIYSGQITNWQEIDGVTGRAIIAYQRPKNSGSQTLMENVVMNGLTMMDAPSERKPGAMVAMLEAIDYKNAIDAIGYSVYYYASQMERKENIKFLAVNGVSCNKDTIRTGEYPFSSALYAITRDGDESESAQKLLAHLLTDKGRRLVETGGYVSIDADTVPEQTRIIRYPEREFGTTELIKYIKEELHAEVIEFRHKIADTNDDFIEDTVETDFVNGYAGTLHISVTNEFDYDTDFVNRPVQLTFEIDGKQAIYQNPWNDGVQAYIFAFTRNDQYMNIIVASSGTGAGDHHTTIYRYDGDTIFKFAEFAHYVGELYSDSSGKIYFVQMQFEGDRVTAPAVMSFDMETGEIGVVK